MAGEGEFVDRKDASALRTIGELCEALRLKAHVLRYWEDQFPMLKPLKRSGGRRYYRPEDVALVREIDRLVNRQGYTLRGARAALKDFAPGEAEPLEAPTIPVAGLQSALPAPPPAPGLSAETIGKLKAIRARLAGALAQ